MSRARPTRSTAVSRRTFLQWGLAGAGAVWLGPACGRAPGAGAGGGATSPGIVLGPGAFGHADGEPTYLLSIVDLEAWARGARDGALLDVTGGGGTLRGGTLTTPGEVGPFLVDLAFEAHGMAPDPSDPARVALFQKRGVGACVVDVVHGEVLATLAPTEGREFYGHGVFSPDGALLYATESAAGDLYAGVVVVRDGRSFAVLGECPSFGVAPHDCALRDDGRTLVVANGGGREADGEAPCVSYVDTTSETLVEKVVFDAPDVSAGHLALTYAGDLVVVGAPRPWMPPENHGAVSLRPSGGALERLREPADVVARMIGESLSVAIHEPSRTVAVTNPRADLLTFWHLDRGELLSALEIDSPRGVATSLDGSHFVVSHGLDPALQLIDTATRERVSWGRLPGACTTGSHIMVHALA